MAKTKLLKVGGQTSSSTPLRSILESTDGINWSTLANDVGFDFGSCIGVFFKGEYFVYSQNSTTARKSTDGISWSSFTANRVVYPYSVSASAPSIFVAKDAIWVYRPYDHLVLSSTDGVNFTQKADLFYEFDAGDDGSTNNSPYHVMTYLDPYFYIFPQNDSFGNSLTGAYRSSDGVSWNYITSLATGAKQWQCASVFNNQNIILSKSTGELLKGGSSGTYSTLKPPGFPSATSNGRINDVNGTLVLLFNYGGTNYYYTSTDGTNFTSHTPENRSNFALMAYEEEVTPTPEPLNVTANFDVKTGMSADLQTTVIHNVSANYSFATGMAVTAALGQAVEPINITANYDVKTEMQANLYSFDPILRTINGTVTRGGSPFANAKVYIVKDDGSKTYSTTSGESGIYSVVVDSPGDYHVMVVYQDELTNKYTSESKAYINISQ